jgi:hypothetical protein
MSLSVALKIPRYEISGDITAGRMNYEILLNKIRDHNLLQLIEGSLEPETSPVSPGDLEEFIAKMKLGPKPGPFNLKRFTTLSTILMKGLIAIPLI